MTRSASRARFSGLDVPEGRGGAILRFDLYDHEEDFIGTYRVGIPPQPEGTTDAVISAGFEAMADIFEQLASDMRDLGSNYRSER